MKKKHGGNIFRDGTFRNLSIFLVAISTTYLICLLGGELMGSGAYMFFCLLLIALFLFGGGVVILKLYRTIRNGMADGYSKLFRGKDATTAAATVAPLEETK